MYINMNREEYMACAGSLNYEVNIVLEMDSEIFSNKEEMLNTADTPLFSIF